MTKRLYTSYYAKSARDPKALATSCKVPAYYHDLKVFAALAPKWEFVLEQIKGTTTWENYVDRYMDLIVDQRKLKAENIVEMVDDGSIFLCYETSAEMGQCHRRLIAKWIEDGTGIVVPEIDWEEPDATPLEGIIEW